TGMPGRCDQAGQPRRAGRQVAENQHRVLESLAEHYGQRNRAGGRRHLQGREGEIREILQLGARKRRLTFAGQPALNSPKLWYTCSTNGSARACSWQLDRSKRDNSARFRGTRGQKRA